MRSELNYKELQEKGVFDLPFTAFQFMQLQRAEIDELQKLYTQQGLNMFNLQKRVDAVQRLIKQWRDVETYSDDCANELEQALKGGGE